MFISLILFHSFDLFITYYFICLVYLYLGIDVIALLLQSYWIGTDVIVYERIREVNNILDQLKHDTYMYESKLSATLSQDLIQECKEFIIEHKESRHKLVMECQRKKYLKLWQQKYHSGNNSSGTGGHSSQDQVSTSKTKCWVVNLSTKPLCTAQETVLVHGPNFAVTVKTPLPGIHNSSGGAMPKPETNRGRRV